MNEHIRELSRSFTCDDGYPASNVAKLIDAGVFAAPFAPALGGAGITLRDAVEIVEAIAEACPSTALLTVMPLGLAGAIAAGMQVVSSDDRDATFAQAEAIAADYRARKIYAACNSEKGAGGSLAATKTVATRDSSGAFTITGEKILASFGRNADVFFSTAKVIGFPNFIEGARPLEYWFCLFAAVPLGCVASMLRALGSPVPTSPALRLRLSEVQMRYEASRAYLLDSASKYRPGADAATRARVLRTKTFVTQEATRLCAELFALSGGRHYVRGGRLSGAMADVFAGTALRPPLALALDTLVETFALE
jgi:alkylation response protein AidB-like acyl-CoA dehydrogenase